MKYFFKYRSFCIVIVLMAFIMNACTSTKKIVYLGDLPSYSTPVDTLSLYEAQLVFESPIQKNDQLWIYVGGSNINDLAVINSANGLGSGSVGNLGNNSGTNAIIGYLVEADGTIKLPYIGKVQAEGLTRLQLEDKLTEMFKSYTKNPVVNVRFLNYSFSVLGEVVKGGRFGMPTERVTILEAISMAGDLTFLAKRENILLIREVNGTRVFARLNLLSKDIFKSPYFYIKANDVIYVEPVNAKFINRSGVPQYLSLAGVGISLILAIISLTK